jgi:hypothetical protein
MGWGTHDDFEIDLTADAPDGLLPIRWVGPPGPATGADPDHTNGNGHNGNGATAVRIRPLPVPRVVTLASFMAHSPTPREDTAREPAPVLDLREPDEWRDALQPITLRDVATSRGARFLTVVAVTVCVALIAAVVLLWQQVEARPAVATPTAAEEIPYTAAELRDLKSRLNSIETRLASLLDPTQTMVTTTPDELRFELAVFRACVIEFQRAIDAGIRRGGQFEYC